MVGGERQAGRTKGFAQCLAWRCSNFLQLPGAERHRPAGDKMHTGLSVIPFWLFSSYAFAFAFTFLFYSFFGL